jgi:hypothetical protein
MMMVVTLDILNSKYNLIENQNDKAKVLSSVSQDFWEYSNIKAYA